MPRSQRMQEPHNVCCYTFAGPPHLIHCHSAFVARHQQPFRYDLTATVGFANAPGVLFVSHNLLFELTEAGEAKKSIDIELITRIMERKRVRNTRERRAKCFSIGEWHCNEEEIGNEQQMTSLDGAFAAHFKHLSLMPLRPNCRSQWPFPVHMQRRSAKNMLPI